jgi:hypothetical protein
MKVTFNGHSEVQREVELSQKQLDEMFELLKYGFMQHLEFTSTFDRVSSYQGAGDRVIRGICDAHGVDVAYKKDRVAFFKAVLTEMKNPYQ